MPFEFMVHENLCSVGVQKVTFITFSFLAISFIMTMLHSTIVWFLKFHSKLSDVPRGNIKDFRLELQTRPNYLLQKYFCTACNFDAV